MTVFEAQHIGVQYQRNGEPFAPFSDVSLALEGGRMYNLTGPSGSGKSTLLAACALTTTLRWAVLPVSQDRIVYTQGAADDRMRITCGFPGR